MLVSMDKPLPEQTQLEILAELADLGQQRKKALQQADQITEKILTTAEKGKQAGLTISRMIEISQVPRTSFFRRKNKPNKR